ncbi:uncharacterized protein KNAG_0B00900 [Huiozyma naganishii CBS 8797]|uniref:Anaphase-promoting complex subunit 4 WD40 domain-containing protein n=1 Tax=Huiozyma naganishii (strain ATCC MYA-139 / BCRC 22969 / CBS 8797 / KCTC 17520 / NBRC 10181 / NCYC 3082 / Yp74L-3) TaxID=1071383 RepID=J7RUM9_HUIN7|nr:hypothetical protein KNAG_0B00900 [Kazachstania naganishii CBS 8797]CCK68537.1 hypothetical protein KNAG_0B00900 [Kazachstania naganishii CBS 8797]
MQDLNLNSIITNDNGSLKLPSWNHNIRFKRVTQTNTVKLAIGSKFLDGSSRICLSNASKQLKIFDSALNNLVSSFEFPHIVKLYGQILDSSFVYLCTYDGTLKIYKADFDVELVSLKLHNRVINHIEFCKKGSDSWYVVSTAVNKTLNISELKLSDAEHQLVPLSSITIPSNCTSLKCIMWDTIQPSIFLTRNDCSQLVCYTLNDTGSLSLAYNIALNTAQFSTYSFEIRSLCFTKAPDGTPFLVAATSHIPYMRLILIRPPMDEPLNGVKTYYDRIVKNFATSIPQTFLSQPIMRYLPATDGMIVGIDDGVYAFDLQKAESWKLDFHSATVKDIDVAASRMVILFSDKCVEVWDTDSPVDH